MRPALRVLCLCLGLGVNACGTGDHTPGTVVQAAGASGDLRETGPHAVALHRLWAPARYTDTVRADVYYPSTAEGVVDGAGAPYRLVVLVQEAGQPIDAFAWLSVHLASWGFVVVVPEFPLGNPARAIDAPQWVIAATRELSGDAGSYLAGGVHGGAAGLVRFNVDDDLVIHLDQDPSFGALTLMGAEPHSSSTALVPTSLLVVSPGRECVSEPAAGFSDYVVRRYLATIPGMSHGQLVDEAVAEGEDGVPDCTLDAVPASDCDAAACEPTVGAEEARRLGRGVVAGFHRQILAGEDLGEDLEDVVGGWEGIDIEDATPAPSVTTSGRGPG